MIVKIIMFLILQWNAQSLIANGQELKRFVAAFKERLVLIGVQETWLKPEPELCNGTLTSWIVILWEVTISPS